MQVGKDEYRLQGRSSDAGSDDHHASRGVLGFDVADPANMGLYLPLLPHFASDVSKVGLDRFPVKLDCLLLLGEAVRPRFLESNR